ncbi:MAG TPA: PD-(D/E)XK nuclease family protein [Terriglobales bacterium]|nr:PD-(D/E)XK nuclease family protein [Terriglobales bacterium]
MTYSYTQVSQYLTCPRRYRHRYLDAWQEKDTRAAMLFGRAFERALAAYFLREDAAAALFHEWSGCQNQGLHYLQGDTRDRMLQQGIQLLDRFCQDDRIRIRQPRHNLSSAAPGVRPVGRRHHPTNRVGTVSAAQRHSLPAESVQHVSVLGFMPGKARVDRCRSHAAARSREPWLA